MSHVAIVTGASSGIGLAIYNHLKSSIGIFNEIEVIGVSRRGPDLRVDLTTLEGIERVVMVVEGQAIDCLINCAGALNLNEWNRDQDWEHIFNINFWAPYRLFYRLRRQLMLGDNTCVINIASVSGMMADPDTPIYGAAKAALISMTKSLAIRWAPHIRVNAISPGFFNTDLVPEPTPKELIDPVPLGFEADCSMILPIVDAILNSSYVTGSNFVVDGGLSCRRV